MRPKLLLILLVMGFQSQANHFTLFEEQGKVGLKNEQGAVLLPPAFEALGWSDGSFSVIGQITGYKLNGRWGLINLKKEFITKAEFESLVFSGADRVVAIKKISGISRKAGSLTLEGETTIPFVYDAITIHGLRAVVMNKVGIDYRFGVTDLQNRVIIAPEFKNIYPLSTLRFAVENQQGKTALYSDAGKPITDFFIDSISVFHRGHAIIYSNGLQGLMDRDGNVVSKPSYQAVEFQDDGSVRALQPDRWKIIDDKNIEVKSMQAEQLQPFMNQYFKVMRAGRWGLLDTNLTEVWPVVYDFIGAPLGGHTSVRKNNKWGLMNFDQKEIIPFQFDLIVWDGTFAFGLTEGLGKSLWSFFNVKDNLKASKKYDQIENLNGQYFKIRKNGYYGLLSGNGKETVHCVYDSILELKANQVAVAFKSQVGIISPNEDWILAPQPFPVQLVNAQLYLEQHPKNIFLKSLDGSIVYFTENKLRVADGFLIEQLANGAIKYVGLDGLEILQPEVISSSTERAINETKHLVTHMPLVQGGLQAFQSQGKFGFRDENGRLAIPNRSDCVKLFSNQMAAFKLLGKWGYINGADKIVVNPAFDYAGDFQNGYALVSRNRKFGLIDKVGAPRLSLQYDSIVHSDSFLKLFLNGKKGLATLQGKVLVEARYDHLATQANGQVLVGTNNRFGMISADGLNIIPIIYSSLEYDTAKNLYLGHLVSEWVVVDVKR